MSDVQIAIIDQENIEVNLAVPGIQGAKGDTGTVAVALDGTAAAPGISFASDTDTGIYRVGANSIGISTGGTGRLFVDASGNVGLGGSSFTTFGATQQVTALVGSAASRLSLYNGATLTADIVAASFAGIGLQLNSVTAAPMLFNTNNIERARIRADGMFEVKGAGTAGSSPAFSVSGSAPASSLVILPTSGYVGLGTSSPQTNLHVIGANNGECARIDGNSGASDRNLIFSNSGNSIRWLINSQGGSTGAGELALQTNSTTRLFIDSSGRVGIGTTSPTQLLHVSGTGGTPALFERTGSNGCYIGLKDASGSLTYLGTSNGVFAIQTPGSGYSDKLVVTSSGNVGIGTTSPTSPLTVQSASNSYAGAINIRSALGGTVGAILQASGSLFLSSNSSGDHIVIDSTGRVGIGTATPDVRTHIVGTALTKSWSADANDFLAIESSSSTAVDIRSGSTAGGNIFFSDGDARARGRIEYSHLADELRFGTAGTYARVVLDSSGRLLVGTSSAQENWIFPQVQVVGTTNATSAIGVFNNVNNNTDTANLTLTKARGGAGGTWVPVQLDDVLGQITFVGADNAGDINCRAASIKAEVDGGVGTNDLPGRLVFSTTADGAASPTPRMTITSNGFTKCSNDGNYVAATGTFHEFRTTINNANIVARSTNASYTGTVFQAGVVKAANSDYTFIGCVSSIESTPDNEFVLRGDGNAFADGTWTGGGADYAEYFEWSDENPDAEDRRGISVVLDGNNIRPALAGEDPIGVISGNPSVVGDAAWNKWNGKYLRDDYGTYIQEDYEVEDEDGNIVIQQRRKLNPAYDPDQEYIPREERPEWDCVGLMGKLRIRKGQPTGSRWIKMRDISDSVEEWLVR